jgi:3-hydroxybutyryl-CoA dehydrogenase
LNPIKKIGVVGEGKMGSSIFLYLNGFDFQLTWLCKSDTEAEKARKTFMKKTRLLFQSGVFTESEYNLKSENTKVTTLIDDLKDCDLIIEAITEDIDVKRILFDSLHDAINEDCIFTTNSSSIIPSQIISSETRKDKSAGLHFFFPVTMKQTVELITSVSTSLQTKDALVKFLIQINKKPFLQNEPNAFVLNRLLLDFQAGAYNIFLEGRLSIEEIDELVKLWFFPVGVFEFFDHVGIDVMLYSIKSYTKNSGNKQFYTPLIHKMEEMVKVNCLGIKTKRGFFDYSNTGVVPAIPINTSSEGTDYRLNIRDRLWSYYLRSAFSIIDSGICSREELAGHIKDYLGLDTDPLELLIPSN